MTVAFVPYQCRHSGPSWDRIMNHWTLEEVQKRGRCKSTKSVVRYGKSVKLMQWYAEYSTEQRACFEKCERKLEDTVHHGLEPPGPPWVAKPGGCQVVRGVL